MTKWLIVVAALLAVTPAKAEIEFYSANHILQYCVSSEQIPPNGAYVMKGFCAGAIAALGGHAPRGAAR
jgi:hypothetical protein